MNFFKSVFSDDPDPPKSESAQSHQHRDPSPAWSFGGLIQSIATKSESVIETYRRDLNEFGSGLKKEIEVAQGSLGTVGTAIDELGTSVLKGTAQIISQGKDAILADGHESDSSDTNLSSSSKPYSRFEAQVRALQTDPGTYCDEPEDSDDYVKWKLGFVLEEKKEDIGQLTAENIAIESIYKRVVPESLDHDSFWCRYFYKAQKLKQAEDLRANLVKRAISTKEDEDLSWDVDDDDDDDNHGHGHDHDGDTNVGLELNSKESSNDGHGHGHDHDGDANVGLELNSKEISNELENDSNKVCESSKDSEEEEAKVGGEEEDLGWDEIEDLSAIDDNKATEDSPKRAAEIRKRLSAAEEDEDLSWDIEDDDDHHDQLTKA